MRKWFVITPTSRFFFFIPFVASGKLLGHILVFLGRSWVWQGFFVEQLDSIEFFQFIWWSDLSLIESPSICKFLTFWTKKGEQNHLPEFLVFFVGFVWFAFPLELRTIFLKWPARGWRCDPTNGFDSTVVCWFGLLVYKEHPNQEQSRSWFKVKKKRSMSKLPHTFSDVIRFPSWGCFVKVSSLWGF